MPNNAIAVLHYNKIRLTKNCIQSILNAGYPPKKIHCFDNGSKPEIFEELKQTFPHCHHQRIERTGTVRQNVKVRLLPASYKCFKL